MLQGLDGAPGSDMLPLLLGLTGAQGAGVTRGTGWAGSSYWKFQKAPGAAGRGEAVVKRVGGEGLAAKRTKRWVLDMVG